MNSKFDNARTQVLVGDKSEAPMLASLSTEAASGEGITTPASTSQVSTPAAVESHSSSYPFIIRPSLGMVLQLGLMVVASIGLALLLIKFASQLESLGNWGYVGVAAVEFGNSAMLAIPTPSYAYTFAMGSILNPFIVGVIGGTFAMLGELIGYYLGCRGSTILPQSLRVERFKSWTSRWGAVVLFWFAILPVPFDIAGIWAGAAHYPLIRFVPVVVLGKTIKITIIALAGYFGMDVLANLAIGFGL
ncbi:MAG: VTT domain-containing protein [Dehalococcoidia bacterium]|nr:VTT domain-containing protein [Dehalococcoidia bacterium]